MLKLIINADDLAIGKDVNAATFALMSRGIVTSATAIANCPLLEETLREAKSFPKCSFGVHLNVTQFEPLTREPGLRPLLDADGCFRGNAIREIRITPQLQEVVFQEWAAQIQRFIALRHPPSHLDSHHNTHTIPGLFSVLKRVQKRFGIRKVRITRNLFGPDERPRQSLLWQKKFWNLALRFYYPTRVTKGFTGFREFHDLVERGALERWLNPSMQQDVVVELMVHPGHAGYREETELLASGWLARHGFALTSFNAF